VSTIASGVFDQFEAPAMFKVAGTYFFLDSSRSYWRSNDNSYATASSISGPWTYRGYFAPQGTKTYNSQTTFVLPVAGNSGTTYVYMGDRWCDTCLPSSTYVWQPLSVGGTTLSMPTFYPGWSINVNAGTWTSVADNNMSVNDATYGSGQNQFNYVGGWGHSSCNSGDNCYNGDNSWDGTGNDTVTMTFTGTQVKLYSVIDTIHGLAGASICDSNGNNCGTETLIDLYAPTQAGNQLVWVSPVQPYGTYTLKLRVTGIHENYSTGTGVTVDRVTIATTS
jgi:hypothetical protein